MAIDWAWNFRATLGFVTDGANEVAALGETYPHTYSGLTGSPVAGWNVAVDGTRDRANTVDRRLAGINFQSAANFWQVDLPSSGSYTIHLAAGDDTNANATAWDVYDGTTLLWSVTDSPPGSNNFYDANNNNYLDTVWPGSETPQTFSFATTTFKLVVRTTGQNNVIAHVRIAGGGGGGGQVFMGWLPQYGG